MKSREEIDKLRDAICLQYANETTTSLSDFTFVTRSWKAGWCSRDRLDLESPAVTAMYQLLKFMMSDPEISSNRLLAIIKTMKMYDAESAKGAERSESEGAE